MTDIWQAEYTPQRVDAEQQVRDRLISQLNALENAADNWASLTAAQKDAASRLAVRTSARLVRLILRQLDTAGG